MRFLRPDQARRHGRRRHREGLPDLLGGEASTVLSIKGVRTSAVDRRVRAHEA